MKRSDWFIAKDVNLKDYIQKTTSGLITYVKKYNDQMYVHIMSNNNWASEASPTLGCSIEISRDICCRYVVCRMSVVCQINCVGGIT